MPQFEHERRQGDTGKVSPACSGLAQFVKFGMERRPRLLSDVLQFAEQVLVATLTEHLLGLMDALGIRKASLAGWSMAGNEMTMLAGSHPDRVERMVYSDGAYDWSDFGEGWKALPSDLFDSADYMGSLETYLARQHATCLPELKDMSILKAYARDKVIIQSDGSLQNRESAKAQLELEKTLLRDRRDYTKVPCPTLAIYVETFVNVSRGDPDRNARLLAWDKRYFAPFRTAAIERVKRELKGVEIMMVPGDHQEFIYTARDQIVEATRSFLRVHRLATD